METPNKRMATLRLVSFYTFHLPPTHDTSKYQAFKAQQENKILLMEPHLKLQRTNLKVISIKNPIDPNQVKGGEKAEEELRLYSQHDALESEGIWKPCYQ